MNKTIKRTNASNDDFKSLVTLLNRELKAMNGEEDNFFSQFNHIDTLNNVVVAYFDGKPAACGAFKAIDDETVEIKRMFVRNEVRGQGLADLVLSDLENWASELGYKASILETGNPVAVKLYLRNKYSKIPNYPPYEGVESSTCMKKELTRLS